MEMLALRVFRTGVRLPSPPSRKGIQRASLVTVKPFAVGAWHRVTQPSSSPMKCRQMKHWGRINPFRRLLATSKRRFVCDRITRLSVSVGSLGDTQTTAGSSVTLLYGCVSNDIGQAEPDWHRKGISMKIDMTIKLIILILQIILFLISLWLAHAVE